MAKYAPMNTLGDIVDLPSESAGGDVFFDEIESEALRKFEQARYLEASSVYRILEGLAVTELSSDQARGFCINNQAVCLFYAKRLTEAQEVSKRCMSFFSSKFVDGMNPIPGSDVCRFPPVNLCYYNHRIISSYLPGYVHPQYEPPLQRKYPYLVPFCSSPDGGG